MDIREMRIARLAELIGKFKTRSAFCRYYNLDSNYLSQIMNGHCRFGEKAARRMEEALGVGRGYLDDTGTHPLDAYKSVYDKANEEVKEMIVQILKAAKMQQERKSAYEHDSNPGGGASGTHG